ncbi:MAG: DUF488 domain-containing protein [candidate division WOR-3 bacterium]
MIKIKRVYDRPSTEDGKRILVDRLWPRGLKKEETKVDEWLKDIAPSDTLRKWFGHDPARWADFKRRYKHELKDKAEIIVQLRNEAKKGQVTLLFAAKDAEHNNAAVLKEVIERQKQSVRGGV